MGHGGSAIVVVSQAGRWLSHGELSSVPVYTVRSLGGRGGRVCCADFVRRLQCGTSVPPNLLPSAVCSVW